MLLLYTATKYKPQPEQGTIFSYTPLCIAVSKFRGAAERRYNFESADDLILTRKAVDIKAYKMNKKIIVHKLPFYLSTFAVSFEQCAIRFDDIYYIDYK